MNLGKVVGTVIATRKDEKMNGSKMLVVQKVAPDCSLVDDFVVAVDSVGAGISEIVLVALGSSARQTEVTRKKPVDAVVMAIVDTIEVEGEILYQKK